MMAQYANQTGNTGETADATSTADTSAANDQDVVDVDYSEK